MAITASVQKAVDHNVNGLLAGLRWDSSHLTYSFPSDSSFYGNSYGAGEPQKNFQPLNAIQGAAVREVFRMLSSVTGLSFAEIEETKTDHATLRLAGADIPAPAWTYLPGESPMAGDVWFNTSGGDFDQPLPGSYAYYIFIHEIAHAVGLKHGHESGPYGAMDAAHDSMEYSVTTYRSYVGADGKLVENETWGFAQSLMMYDIAALQHLYGANFSTNSGNTEYRWDPATGQASINGARQAAPGDNRVFMTVWDGGGVDTYNLWNYTTNMVIDLRPGAWSRMSGEQTALLGYQQEARGNIANALQYQGDTRSLIENAIGGSGNDRINGNAASNLLKGRTGDDRIYGFEGNDTLNGGPGRDVLTGGSGNDVFMFDGRPNRAKNLDRITDFSPVDDTIHLDNAVFTKVGAAGKLIAGAFRVGREAHDSSDRIIYDRKTGALSYDPDGNGKAAQIQFAHLNKGLKLAAADFWIV